MISVFVLAPAAVLLFEASSVSALSLDANIAGIFTNTTFTTPAAGATLDPSGDIAFADLQIGQGVLVTIDVANPQADEISLIAATLTVAGDQFNLIAVVATTSILIDQPPGFPPPPSTSLLNFNSGTVKPNSPGQFGSPGDVWIQALSYLSSLPGTTGTGPDIAVVQLFFEVLPGAVNNPVNFVLSLTTGDGIHDGSGLALGNVTFSGATIAMAVPEPGAALLLSLGLMGLATAGRRGEGRVRV